MTTPVARCIEFVVALALTAASGAVAQHHGDGGLNRKPYEFSGYIETSLTHYRLDRDSAFYKIDFAGQPQRDTLERTSATLRLTGSARAGDWRLRFQSRSTLAHDALAHDTLNRFDELAASWKPHPGFALDAGKMALKWGKGHSWNPVAFVERPKDASDPRLPREGYSLISATVTRAFDGALQSIAFSPVLMPVSESINHTFGRPGHLNAAAKFHLDFGATETGVYFLNGGSRSGRFGFDFSHDITSNLEFYGEWARIKAQDFRLVTPDGASTTRKKAATSYLAGMQYRTQRRNNFIVELHHNGTGYTVDEFRDFVTLVNSASQAGAASALMARAQRLADGGFGRQKAMQNYLYLRASQEALPLSLSIRASVNLQDGSYSVTPELLYNVRGHWSVRARLTLLGGGAVTEYGAKYYSRRAEIRLHYHF